jgi:hypothetical protein
VLFGTVLCDIHHNAPDALRQQQRETAIAARDDETATGYIYIFRRDGIP